MQSAMDHHIISIAGDVTPASQRKQRRNVTRRRQRLQRPEAFIAPILLTADAEIEVGGADLRQIDASIEVEGGRTKSGSIEAKEISSCSNNKGRKEIERNSKINEGGKDEVKAEESCSTAEAEEDENGEVRRRQKNRNSGVSTLNSNSTSCMVSCASAMGEGHRVISTEYRAAATQAIMKVTILAAGFVIGSRGISARLIGQATGAVVHSWTEYGGDRRNSGSLPPAPVRLFRIDGKKSAVQAAVSLIHDAVARYKQLCESKRRGEFVQREQIINGVEFYYQPPPRKAFISVSIPMNNASLVNDGTPRNPSVSAAANRSPAPPPPPPPHHLQSQAPPPFRIDASPTPPPPRSWFAAPPSPAAPSAVALSPPPPDSIRAAASVALRRPPFLSWPPLRRPQCRDPTTPALPPPAMHDVLICSLRRPSQPPMPSSHLLSYYMNHPGLQTSSSSSAAGAMKSPRSTTSTVGSMEAIRPQISVEHFRNKTAPAPATKESRQRGGADCSLFSAFGQPDILAHQRLAEKVGVSEGMAGGGEACARTAFEFTACDFLRKSLPPYVLRAAGTAEEQWAPEYCLFGGSPTLVEHPALGSLGGAVERMSAAPEASGISGISAVDFRQPPWI